MRAALSLLVAPLICMSMQAQSRGGLRGKVINKAGTPLADVTVTIKRINIEWSKEIKTDSKGTYAAVGLEPNNYEIAVEVQGYAKFAQRIRVSVGNPYLLNITMMTPDEYAKALLEMSSSAKGAGNLGAALDSEGAGLFNAAVALYNEQKFAEALPLIEKAHAFMSKAVEQAKNDKAKAESDEKLAQVEKVYVTCLFETGKADAEHKKELWAKAEPIAQKMYAANPKDPRAISYLAEFASAKGDEASAKKYQELLESITGPDPRAIYNKAVEAFNAGNMNDAKTNLEKSIQLDPKYPDAYYLLGMTEYGLGNMKGAKVALTKYIELAPAGKDAPTVREMLRDPSFKSIN